MVDNNVRFQDDVSDLFVKYGINSYPKPLGEQKTKKVLKFAVEDYFAKKITASQLESLGTQLYYKLNNTSQINSQWDSFLSNALQRLTDFGYYVENSDTALVKKIENELRKFK